MVHALWNSRRRESTNYHRRYSALVVRVESYLFQVTDLVPTHHLVSIRVSRLFGRQTQFGKGFRAERHPARIVESYPMRSALCGSGSHVPETDHSAPDKSDVAPSEP